ncbi:MAG: alpha/beta hydrolase [Cyclobacteriaceae bacterium]
MNKLFIIFTLLNVSGCFLSCTFEEPAPAPENSLEFQSMANVSYGSDPRQVYDIVLPQNRTLETKVMILIHGGGWKSGSKSDMIGFRDFMRDQFPHMALVNMNYRLADKNHAPFPMQIEDINAVIEDLLDKQQEYQIGQDEDLLMAASPLFQAHPAAPPTILFYGGNDPLIPNSQGSALNERLGELGVSKEFHFYPYEGHGWIGLNLLDSTFKLKFFIDKFFGD